VACGKFALIAHPRLECGGCASRAVTVLDRQRCWGLHQGAGRDERGPPLPCATSHVSDSRARMDAATGGLRIPVQTGEIQENALIVLGVTPSWCRPTSVGGEVGGGEADVSS
jgi:hypothetical protein